MGIWLHTLPFWGWQRQARKLVGEGAPRRRTLACRSPHRREEIRRRGAREVERRAADDPSAPVGPPLGEVDFPSGAAAGEGSARPG